MQKTYKDASLAPAERAALLLGELSLGEKMAQVTGVANFTDQVWDMDWFRAHMPYGIGTVTTLELRRVKTLEEASRWLRTVQEIAMEQSPHHIPAAFHMEGLCGAFVQDAASFPCGVGRGSSFDPELEEAIGRIVARQEAALAMTQTLAPVLDVAYDPRFGRSGESYGEDPALVSAMGTAYARGLQSEITAGRRCDAIAKHFLGFHTAAGGIHGTHSTVTERMLIENYGTPFQAAIRDAGLKGIMPCYDTINGEPPSASAKLLQHLLREEMGFDGICFSDYGAISNLHRIDRLGESIEDAGYRCMKAGVDLEAPNADGFGPKLADCFRSGEADVRILDRACQRVLEEKFRTGLFEHPYPLEGEELRKIFVQPGDTAIIRRSAEESIILLRNDGILPLSGKIRTAAVIGPHAASARKLFGGYTHLRMMESCYAVANSIAGVAGAEPPAGVDVKRIPGTTVQDDDMPELEEVMRRQKPHCRSILGALRDALPETEFLYEKGYPVAGEDTSGFDAALAAAEKADLVIVTLGGRHGTCSLATMGEGVDGTNINLPPCQEAFLRKLSALHKPTVGLHLDGRPISSDAADETLSAILECWSPAEEGAGSIADVLTGKINPSGHLPVTAARSAGQLPMIYNHPSGSSWHQEGSIGFANYVDMPHTPRYPFGYGLSYTDFAYSDLSVTPEKTAPFGEVSVRFTLKNVGRAAGTAVPQLYLRDEYASMVRPVKALAGFLRVPLSPGESRKVEFRVRPSFLAFLDEDMKWRIEKGRVLVMVGASSEDIRLEGSFVISASALTEGRNRQFAASGRAEA